jgi:hypothetical protein
VLASGEVGHGEVNKRQGNAIAITCDRLVEEIRPGGRRRAAAQRRCGRGGSDGSEERGGAQQCAALEASMWPREDVRQVPGLRGSAATEARAPAIVRLGLIDKRLGKV